MIEELAALLAPAAHQKALELVLDIDPALPEQVTGDSFRVRQVLNTLWKDAPDGIPGNDDLGAMSSWYVWAAMGLYPGIPGRSELFIAAPLFPRIVVHRANGRTIAIDAPGAASQMAYVRALRVNDRDSARAWLPDSFVRNGGTLRFTLSATPVPGWGAAAADAPPSFGGAPRK